MASSQLLLEDFAVPEFRRTGSASLIPSFSSQEDRFIPARTAMNAELSHFNLTCENATQNVLEDTPQGQYKSALTNSLYNGELDNAKVLAFKAKAPGISSFSSFFFQKSYFPLLAPKDSSSIARSVLYSQNRMANDILKASHRHIPSMAEKVLDAPDMLDDFYLNLLDWSPDNILAVALNQSVYLWHASDGRITKLMEVKENETVTSVSWVPLSTPHIAIGTSDPHSCVQLWDVNKQKRLRNFDDHHSRVGALSWNKHVLTSGSADQSIVNRDVRQKEAVLSRWTSHTQEVIGLKWSPDGTQLASGGNDNMLNIWDGSRINTESAPIFALSDHVAAVKALDWCPWESNLLASGGGTADRTLRFWNTKTGACVNSIDTMSQICSVRWSTHYRELVTSHGYSKNQLTVWKYPSLARVAELTGHTSRVLHMALSPDGQTVATAAGDEVYYLFVFFYFL